MDNNSDLKIGAIAEPPPQIGENESENEDEKQVSAKKQKRDEVVEEQGNNNEIISDDSFSDSEPRKPKMLATPNEQNAGSKTIYTRNLSYSVERTDLEDLFKECGEIVDVRLHTDYEGRFRGFGHVEFATAEAAQKALELNNFVLLQRRIAIGIARERGEYTSNRSNWNDFHKCARNPSPTIFVKGFDSSLPEGKIKASLEEHFGSCGEIARISVPVFHDSGAAKGFAHLEFKDVNSANKALHLDQTELGGYHLLVERAKKTRPDNQGIGSDRGGGSRHEFRRWDGSGYSSRAGWGISGGGGWHSSFSDENAGRKNHFY
ncbi:nucleolin 2 [Cajanus cajan]|uniref:nucleolin 2 n=1 Tax=Cajanus cajan TaxID=3821 RepID=UPI00098D82A0|nr:nucleolin 2 [Cajanus cajan]XP_020202064.1 nucleolin 2 [Cajanus cajan]XP_020202065.1 nucleolin 2 [Cajanus cajan]XP_020202066.1 nucleolin 2 [Cajanus cajan]XP_020202067.1 nucleolin 2 [Cajanus cajan]XP_020202068.1 nucleolin 2 [Cajanus cajan]XP_020202069.1 nucleolin 2 [Cajanus cajan]XP_020202070.1 nucleolin 2 [Cajanus cajan]XP_029124966.1 nucleolin 2 [Cajanus cajan]XP_029124967.1 nucleolin 2 [Cajanus cajan]